MPVKKETFTIVQENMAEITDVDDSRGRSVPQNMNFVETGFLSKDTGVSLHGATETELCHSLTHYKKKDGTEYQVRAKGSKLQQFNTGTSVWDDLERSLGAVTITNATPAVATKSTHTLIEGDTVYFTTDGALPAGVVSDTIYYVIAAGLTANAFQFSLTVGGAAINTTNAGSGTHTLFKGWRTGAYFGWIVYDDVLYGGNAVEEFFKWDGTTFTDYPTAPKGNILEVFEDRMFITGVTAEPLTAYYSGVGTPTTFGGTDLLKPLGTDSLTGLVNFSGTMLIFKQDSIWKLTFVYDQVVSLFVPKLEIQSNNYGACSRKAIAWVENDIWFFTGREVRSIGFKDQQIGILGVNNSVLSDAIKETLFTIDVDNYDLIAAFYFDRKFYLSVPLGETETNTVFVSHLLYKNVWTKYVDRIKSSAIDFMEIDGEIYSAKSQTPYGVLKWSTTLLNDNEVAIPAEVFFDRIEDKDFNKFIFYRYLDLMFKDLQGRVTVSIKSSSSDLRVTQEKEFIVGSIVENEEMGIGEVPLGQMLYADSFGETTDYSPFQKKRVSFLAKSQSIVMGLKNDQLSETFTIAQFALSGHKKPRKLFSGNKIVSV
jgi:hypothetical protein